MSDMAGTMNAMSDNAAPAKRTRGKTRSAGGNWRRGKDDSTAVIKLELDLSGDPFMLRRVEAMQEAAFRLRRALQRDARDRCAAYWRHSDARAADPKAVRERLALTRKGLEAAAKRHVDDSGWMRDHLTKALGLHIADEVWNTVDRHLFADASGKRHGAPRIGDWFDFARIPGRARSHTKLTPTWETFRLVGSLDGHLNTYRHPDLPAKDAAAASAAALPAGTPVLAQPQSIPAPVPHLKGRKADWRGYDGPLAVVFTGLPAGDLALPVRLPQGSGQQPHLAHFLADPDRWHKIDLVRVQDRKAPGGWRYYAHLMVLVPGYQSESTRLRRSAAAVGRIAGIDGNVSKLAIVSAPKSADGPVLADYVTVSVHERGAAQRAASKARQRQKALDRSRRNSNTAQYELGKRQAERAARRTAAGLAPKHVESPKGQRVCDTAGRPKRSYRRDELSAAYRRIRTDHAVDSRAASQAKQARARDLAGRIVATHGADLITEHVDMGAWARLWGRGIALFSPGMLIAALNAEAAACGGQMAKAATRHTAMSQHCLCGARVPKTLADRTHSCRACGFTWDRDLTSAALAACVNFANSDDPATAGVNQNLADAMLRRLAAQQERQIAVNRHEPPTSMQYHWQGATDGSSEPSLPLPDDASAHRRNPEQARPPGRRRKRAKTKREKHDLLRVNS
jgi:transposase